MNKITRLILVSYFAVVTCSALFVPWSYNRNGVRLETEYGFILSEMEGMSIDYGRVVLELVAFTGLAGIAYLLQERLEKFANFLNQRIKSSYLDTKTYLTELKSYWFAEEFIHVSRHVTITRFRVILSVTILVWVYMVNTGKNITDLVKMIFGHQ